MAIAVYSLKNDRSIIKLTSEYIQCSVLFKIFVLFCNFKILQDCASNPQIKVRNIPGEIT